MLQFEKNKINKLKDYLYKSEIHDSVLTRIDYTIEKKELLIKSENLIFNKSISFIFEDVDFFIVITGNQIGQRDSVLSLTVELDYSNIHNFTKTKNLEIEKDLYLLFQMFSGDEIHIVAKKVKVVTM